MAKIPVRPNIIKESVYTSIKSCLRFPSTCLSDYVCFSCPAVEMVVKAIKDSSNSIALCVIKPPSMEELELLDKTGARTPWIDKTDMV